MNQEWKSAHYPAHARGREGEVRGFQITGALSITSGKWELRTFLLRLSRQKNNSAFDDTSCSQCSSPSSLSFRYCWKAVRWKFLCLCCIPAVCFLFYFFFLFFFFFGGGGGGGGGYKRHEIRWNPGNILVPIAVLLLLAGGALAPRRKTRMLGWEIKWNGPFNWKFFGKKGIPSEVFLFSRSYRNYRKITVPVVTTH